jgi:hypothetical protein
MGQSVALLEVMPMENWGPYLMIPTVCKKSAGGKVQLRESLDAGLLRQELISQGLPLEVIRINNPWLFRKKGAGAWFFIGESDDIEDDFSTDWDITLLPSGTYEITGAMKVTIAEGIEEQSVDGMPTLREVRVTK